MKKESRSAHPNPFNFISMLTDLYETANMDLNRLENGIQITRQRSPRSQAKLEWRKSCMRALKRGEQSNMEFLHRVSYPTKFGVKFKGTISAEWTPSTSGNSCLPWPEKAAEALPESEENNADVGATAAKQDACFLCGQARAPPSCLYPCGHTDLCLGCAEDAKTKEGRCPHADCDKPDIVAVIPTQ